MIENVREVVHRSVVFGGPPAAGMNHEAGADSTAARAVQREELGAAGPNGGCVIALAGSHIKFAGPMVLQKAGGDYHQSSNA